MTQRAFRASLHRCMVQSSVHSARWSSSLTWQTRSVHRLGYVRQSSYWTHEQAMDDAYAARQRHAARQLLGLSQMTSLHSHSITRTELRAAYFVAAKQSHPDSRAASYPLVSRDLDATERFRAVTEAYELLLSWIQRNGSTTAVAHEDDGITTEEENEYRHACLEWLGQSAETVEESKQCPLFRQWLCGRTDAAFHWQNFFMLHGGLAPTLRPTRILLASNKVAKDDGTTATAENEASRIPPPQRRRKRN